MKKTLLISLVIIVLGFVTAAVMVRNIVFKPNAGSEVPYRIFVPAGSTVKDVTDSLFSEGALNNTKSFMITASLKNFSGPVKPGFYRIEKGMSNNNIINMFRAGKQAPVDVTFNNIRTLNDLAGKVGGRIEADSAAIMAFLSDPSNYSEDGFTYQTVISVFVPDTYQLYWITDAEGFYKRMLREYKSFWNEERLAAAGAEGLKPVEVSTLASIIDDEVSKDDEKPRIAGVYLNRLRLGIPLQSDPTIKFALNDFTIRRVLKPHLKVISPYNTYAHRGLPPGPVRCPSKTAIDAVLNAEKHDFIYFVAKSDFSGYHHFSRTLAEHNRYASAYQRELNKRKIYE
ncbi:MAG TPA: endolytic transglycosylase MltG [Bacteroidales bacterium]|nr:endolytic transglycosylase MltG [Bacteroidales bacterium]